METRHEPPLLALAFASSSLGFFSSFFRKGRAEVEHPGVSISAHRTELSCDILWHLCGNTHGQKNQAHENKLADLDVMV